MLMVSTPLLVKNNMRRARVHGLAGTTGMKDLFASGVAYPLFVEKGKATGCRI